LWGDHTLKPSIGVDNFKEMGKIRKGEAMRGERTPETREKVQKSGKPPIKKNTRNHEKKILGEGKNGGRGKRSLRKGAFLSLQKKKRKRRKNPS